MGYFTVMYDASSKFEEKKSVFIGNVKRVDSEEEAKDFINTIKSQHREARHNVYAYVIGNNMGVQRYNDDGEPKGTGGIPVLDVIKKNNLTDVVIVVTRYFGGVLLGTGGLTRAYSKAASLAVKKAEIVEKVLGCPINIEIEYELLGKVQYYCNKSNWNIENINYSDKVSILMYCELSKLEKLKSEIAEVTYGRVVVYEGDEEYYFKSENMLYLC